MLDKIPYDVKICIVEGWAAGQVDVSEACVGKIGEVLDAVVQDKLRYYVKTCVINLGEVTDVMLPVEVSTRAVHDGLDAELFNGEVDDCSCPSYD